LYERLRTVEAGGSVNRLFFLAVPSDLYLSIAHSIAGAGLVYCGLNDPWSRVVIEKPFGRDRESSDLLASELGKVFVEDQTFRIDHYLGKEVIQNLMVLRFANAVFEPLWNRDCIERVRITWKEDFGCDGRGGYFDRYGIIRDVMQNHLLQMLALIAMERPESVKSTHVRNAKVSLLRQVYPVSIDDLLTGQYVGSRQGDMVRKGYAEDATVPADSMTPTFASAVLRINNDRWQGVPFLITAGKALDARMTEIRIIFKKMPGNLFCKPGKCPEQNELLIHVQPDESIHLKIVSKVPGLDLSIEPRQLDLRYESAFAQKIPEAYECLLLDVLEGDRGLFIRSDELEASWDVFTPVLRESESRRIKPEPYEYGSKGPAGADKMAERNGYGD
jgi:glucose-6-phosphate 1-dehydrogenase